MKSTRSSGPRKTGTPPLSKDLTQDVIDGLATVNVSADRFERWRTQFPVSLQSQLLDLVSKLETFDYARFNSSLRTIHRRLLECLARDGFDIKDVDFTKPYTARSGDLVAYFYRRENRIPSARIIPAELLRGEKRALVVLDDYVGTFAQLMGEFYGARFATSFNRYEKIYVVVIAAHERALENLARVKRGETDAVATDLARQFGLNDVETRDFRAALNRVDGPKLELIFTHLDRPFDATEKDSLFAWVEEHLVFERSPHAPRGTAGLASRLAFFYGPPNGTPDILWNEGWTSEGIHFTPLFARVEDISHYDSAARRPESEWVRGGR